MIRRERTREEAFGGGVGESIMEEKNESSSEGGGRKMCAKEDKKII